MLSFSPIDGRLDHRLTVLVATLAAALTAGCLKTVAQDKATGKDGTLKGAKRIKLEEYGDQSRLRAEGRAKDVVTYPGGDRVDWWKLDIPEGRGGKLRVKMKVRPPRRGHEVVFNVYDPLRKRVARVRPDPKKRTKTVTITQAVPGTYYIQVYAPRRKDAGKYRLQVKYVERRPEEKVSQVDVDVPDPPSLPAIPEVEVECQKDVDCQQGNICRQNQCVKKLGPCDKCTDSQECQNDVCVDVERATCLKARVARIAQTSSGALIVTLNRGSQDKVAAKWKGTVLSGRTSRPLSGGSFRVSRVTTKESVAKISVSVDQIRANKYVKLCPP